MTRQFTLLALMALIILNISCARRKPAAPQALSPEAAALVARMPVASAAEASQIAAELIKLGPDQVVALCAQLKPWTGQDAAAQFTLAALTVHAGRPGAEADRKLVARAYLVALKTADNDEIKGLLVRQLASVGRDEAVPFLRDLIADPELSAPAIQALAAISTPKATTTLVRALNTRVPMERKISLIQALGGLRANAASREIRREASSTDPALRLVALWAVANLGDPKGETLLIHATRSESVTERNKAVSFYLLYARRRAEAGDPAAAAAICRRMLAEPVTPENRHAHSAALETLIAIEGERAMPDLLAAVDAGDAEYTAAALRLAAQATHPADWVNKLNQVQAPGTRAAILRMLGESGNSTALPAVLKALEDPDEGVRLAAATAAGKMADDKAVAALVRAMNARSATTAELDNLKTVLLQLPAKDFLPALVAAYPQATPAARVRTLEILGARAATDHAGLAFSAAAEPEAEVRLAALKALRELAGPDDLGRTLDLLLAARPGAETTAARNAVLAAAERAGDRDAATAQFLKTYAAAPAAKKPMLLEYLPRLGSPAALTAARRELKSGPPPVRDAALRAMADWPDAAPMTDLLALSKSGRDARTRILAYRGYVRLVGLKPVGDAEKVGLLKQAMDSAPAPAEIKPVLAALAEVGHPEAFRLATARLDDPALREEAALAAIAIAGKLGKQNAAEVRAALGKIAAAPFSAATQRKARGALNELGGK